jgi:hypothetical protein
MKAFFIRTFTASVCILLSAAFSEGKDVNSATVPMVLDHNRMLVDAQFQQKDGSAIDARLWVDTGNPDFMMSEAFARKLGIDLSEAEKKAVHGRLEVPPPANIYIGGVRLNFEGVKSYVVFAPAWLFNTMKNDANLPSTVLKKYQIVFDYPKKQFTIAEPGVIKPQGDRCEAAIHPDTGIVQVDAVIDGENYSFALDNGASYSFTSVDLLEKLSKRHPDWPRMLGAAGCANMWGWWPPNEAEWPVMRVPGFKWGSASVENAGIVGLPNIFGQGKTIGDWYSQKTARPVDGFLGANILKAFRVEIDYKNSAVYFEKAPEFDTNDMDTVGITIQPLDDGKYQVLGIVRKDGNPAVEGVKAGDKLLKIDDLAITGATMGTVSEALRGKPGDIRSLTLERDGKSIIIKATVKRLL